MKAQHWTLPDLEFLPEDGSRYEIVDGELYLSKQPDMQHQIVCGNVFFQLKSWSNQTQTGVVIYEPGIIFTNDNAVVPDVVWISNQFIGINEPARRAESITGASPVTTILTATVWQATRVRVW